MGARRARCAIAFTGESPIWSEGRGTTFEDGVAVWTRADAELFNLRLREQISVMYRSDEVAEVANNEVVEVASSPKRRIHHCLVEPRLIRRNAAINFGCGRAVAPRKPRRDSVRRREKAARHKALILEHRKMEEKRLDEEIRQTLAERIAARA